jgi:hypothetical protein
MGGAPVIPGRHALKDQRQMLTVRHVATSHGSQTVSITAKLRRNMAEAGNVRGLSVAIKASTMAECATCAPSKKEASWRALGDEQVDDYSDEQLGGCRSKALDGAVLG